MTDIEQVAQAENHPDSEDLTEEQVQAILDAPVVHEEVSDDGAVE